MFWAAALGRSFSLALLERVIERPRSELLAGALELERRGLIRPKPDGHDFAHDLVRRGAYRHLSEPRRRLVHLRIARALKEMIGEDGALAGARSPALVAQRRQAVARAEADRERVPASALARLLPAIERGMAASDPQAVRAGVYRLGLFDWRIAGETAVQRALTLLEPHLVSIHPAARQRPFRHRQLRERCRFAGRQGRRLAR